MVNYGGYATAVNGVCTDPAQMANACVTKEQPSGWEEINRRLELLCGNVDRMAQESWSVRLQLVGARGQTPSSMKPEEQTYGDFISITLANLSKVEDMLASVYCDIQAIKQGEVA